VRAALGDASNEPGENRVAEGTRLKERAALVEAVVHGERNAELEAAADDECAPLSAPCDARAELVTAVVEESTVLCDASADADFNAEERMRAEVALSAEPTGAAVVDDAALREVSAPAEGLRRRRSLLRSRSVRCGFAVESRGPETSSSSSSSSLPTRRGTEGGAVLA
jgi:hypothetical protein